MSDTGRLVGALEALGYTSELRLAPVRPPASGYPADVVAFTRVAPKDLRTSAISAFAASDADLNGLLDSARKLATPFAFVELPGGDLALHQVKAKGPQRTEAARRISASEIESLGRSDLARELEPRAIRAAKSGMRQLTLFPVDARLLVEARSQSVDSISRRLEESFRLAIGEGIEATDAARLAIEALAAVIVRDKYDFGGVAPRNVVEVALARHGTYFAELAEWQDARPNLVEQVLSELGTLVDYSAIDARSINSVYEQLFLTPELRKDLGIFNTKQRLASRIVDRLPIEEIPPEARYVVDPACGAGSLLLAAQERLEDLSPGRWSATDTHEWLKAQIYGGDIEATAVEVAKLSMLVSSLPLGNSWRIEQRDALQDSTSFRVPPTIWVTNPPWRNHKGARDEVATKFLAKAVNALADGGLLACILPASWLSASSHTESRQMLGEHCDVFEVWRLPRDLFNVARFPAAVVFARKGGLARRHNFGFRWVTAGAAHRADFLDRGDVQFQSAIPISASDEFVGGPTNCLEASNNNVGSIADLRGGLVQRGSPELGMSNEGVPFLLRGTPVSILRSLDDESVSWVPDPWETFRVYEDQAKPLRRTPKLLVQADRSPDNAWRLRSVVDSIGVVPCNTWQIITAPEQVVWALNALLSTSVAACFVHSRATTKRITLDVLREIPLPSDWTGRYEERFARVGYEMANGSGSLAPLVDTAEELARLAFGLDDATVAAIKRVMAGFKAPEGRIRFPEGHAYRVHDDATSREFVQASGVVLNVGRTQVSVWVHGGPEEGFVVDIHKGMPGWLLEPNAMFELTGDPQNGHYRLHRTAFLASDDTRSYFDDGDWPATTIEGQGRTSGDGAHLHEDTIL